jgi:uncharacterized membrane protein YqiK
MSATISLVNLLAAGETVDWLLNAVQSLSVLLVLIGLVLMASWFSIRYIPNNYVGIVEKLWSGKGSVPEGCIIALHGEAGFQADLLRGGVHFGLWRWQYRIHKVRLVTVSHGKIGYIYARDGEPLAPSQTLGRVVSCNNFQDARTFLGESPSGGKLEVRGQRGRQRAILREGVYAINPALFVVITEDSIYTLRHIQSPQEVQAIGHWQQDLREIGAFDPVVVGGPIEIADPFIPNKTQTVDSIGVVTVQDGPSLLQGEIIAPSVGNDAGGANYHNNFQDTEAFLAAGGRRGRQYQTLTDGTYFINRWFASVEMIPKTVVPIGYVGVVVSYFGQVGRDLSGEKFRHGERVAEGERGVWERALGPGKYAFNTYAGTIILVPTTNFVLHWITGRSEAHRYDESLRSIDLVTKDAYEPLLPLSVVVHIDYQKAPSVIQRFGDIKKLITQTLDPMLSAYFRDVAHKRTMLGLLQQRDDIQQEARSELRRRFGEFDIECVDVLIGKPDTAEAGGKIETLLEQLRTRQLSVEQLETYDRQKDAADKLRVLNEAQAQAAKQTELTNSRVQIQISESQGEADLARARKQAEQTVVVAEAELARARRQAEQMVVLAQADSDQKILVGRGEAKQIMQVGLSEASVLQRKIASFGDSRLYALEQLGEYLSRSKQPLVPERVFVSGGNGDTSQLGQTSGMLGMLLNLLVAEKSGFAVGSVEQTELKAFSDRMAKEMMDSMTKEDGPSATATAAAPRSGPNGK